MSASINALVIKKPKFLIPTATFVISSAWLVSANLFAASFEPPRDCFANSVDETATLKHVIDGDTLVLEDGRHVRVIGVNAPEVKRKNQAAEPLAEKAKQKATDFFGKNKTIHLRYGKDRYDRHLRLLADVYRHDKKSLAMDLIAEGLGFHISIAPNVSAADCLLQAEDFAKKNHLGVWQEKYFAYQTVKQITTVKSGFQLLKGKVVSIKKTKKNWWLNLDGPVVIKINEKNLEFFPENNFKQLRNKEILVRGWLTKRKVSPNSRSKPGVMEIYHPSAMEIR